MDLEARIDRLEDALTRLAEAQARTEERISRLEEAVIRLAEAQARTEVRLEALAQAQARTEVRLEALAQAQARTEVRLEALAQAQARTEVHLEALAQAQARTEVRLEALVQAQARTEGVLADLALQVRRLSDTIGFTLEDLAREVTPPYLAQHYGIQIGAVDRRFFSADGEEVELDLYGEGQRDGQRVVVAGEVRSRIYDHDVQGAVRRAERLRAQLPGSPVVVLFGFVIHPSARDAARRLGAIVISSSGRLER